MSEKVFIKTFGCQMNKHDAVKMAEPAWHNSWQVDVRVSGIEKFGHLLAMARP